MEPLLFRILDINELNSAAGMDLLQLPCLKANQVEKPDLVQKPDIFCENCLSDRQKYKNFSLFKQVDRVQQSCILVSPIYLEHLEESGYTNIIKKLVEYLAKKYPRNWTVFQYNHDNDFSKHNWIESYPTIRILQFNTSNRLPNDIVLPFWNINTDPIEEKKRYFGGMIAQINNPLRANLLRTLSEQPGYYVENSGNRKYSKIEFLKRCSEFVFNFCPRGMGLSSYRFFETFHIGSIPVLIADDIILPYESEIDYSNICVRIPQNKVSDFMYINNVLRTKDHRKMIKNAKDLRERFTLKGVQEHIYKELRKPCGYSG